MFITIVTRLSRAYSLAIFFLVATGITPSICLSQAIVHEIPDTTSRQNLAIRIQQQAYIDSIRILAFNKLDTAKSEFDSVMRISDHQLNAIETRLNGLKSRFDSLIVVQKVDSILHWKDERLRKIAGKSDSVQQAIKDKLNNLPLPPELREKANRVLSEISSVQSPLARDVQSNIRSIGNLVPGISDRIQSIASIGSELRSASSLQNLDVLGSVKVESMPNLQQQMPDMPPVPKVGELNAENLTKTAEQQLSNSSVTSSIQEQMGEGSQVASVISKAGDEEAMKQQLIQQAQQQATDHFKGKADELNKAMASIAKHKSRISSVTSLNDIPKRVPNEMKGKPFIERLVPGLAFQLLKKDDLFTMDFNLYTGYRFTKRLTLGTGWNERVGLNTKALTWASGDVRIYGPRVFGSYKLSRGFEPRLEVEAMNTFIPPFIRNPNVDPGSRRWVVGAFAGISKTYKISKHIRGTAMVMFRLFDPNRTSPYPDVVNARFGIEVPLKKKTRPQGH